MAFLEKNKFSFPEAGPKDLVKFAVKWNGAENDIEYVYGHCGCTNAYFENGYIMGTLDITKVGQLNEGLNSVNKTVSVYVNDGRPENIAGEKKRKIPNREKVIERITLSGIVKV